MREKQNRNLPQGEELAERRSPSPMAIAGFGALLTLAAIICYQVLQPVPIVTALPPPPLRAQAEPRPAPAPVAEQPPPVRVPNPFDKSEVFEFPPGTPPEEAHAAVADTLLARARERQAEYDARHSRRKRSG